MMPSQLHSEFMQILARDAWNLPQVAELIRQFALLSRDTNNQPDSKLVCITLLSWTDELAHVGTHDTNRRYTRLQFIENALSLAGLYLTRRDFEPWFLSLPQYSADPGGWQPNNLLPYAAEDSRIQDFEEKIDELEHQLHQTEVALNRTKAELSFIDAERKHFIAVTIENIHTLVRQDFEKSTSWRVTKPLRSFAAWARKIRSGKDAQNESTVTSLRQTVDSLSNPTLNWDSVIPPWDKPGYSTEAAWRGLPDSKFNRNDYSEWCKRYESVTNIDALTSEARTLADQNHSPLFSILMTVDQSPAEYFKQAVSSVKNQVYEKWELCIAVSTRTDASVIKFIELAQQSDSRIKYVTGDLKNGNLLNKAKLLATGDWLGILNAINTIPSQAIYMLAKATFLSENYKFIYSDSDKLEYPDFARCKPDFKPDWNLNLFYSQNYTRDLCFYSKELIADCGEFNSKLTSLSAATFDLTLRAIERIHATDIYHVPKVLVHHRVLAESSADDVAHLVQSLNEHFKRTEQNAVAIVGTESAAKKWDIHYSLPSTQPLVSLIIPTKNNLTLLQQCVTSILLKTEYENFEILVVDNGSDQNDTLDYLRQIAGTPKVRVIRDNYAFNYSALNNSTVALSKGEIIAFLNDDIEVITPNWLSEMVSHALRPRVGAVGARLWYPDMKLQHAGIVLAGGVARHVHKFLPAGEPGFNDRAVLTQNFSAVTGACMVVKKSLFESVGGFNEKELAIGFNDVDFCLRLVEAGYRNVWTPQAELFHHESATRGQDDAPDKQRRAEKEYRFMRERWDEKMEIDPAYNPNLTSGHDDFSLAWPPRADTI
uniref:Glycosyl transferase, group 2 family protein n=1 Tax=uncultured bacterium A1Q1_fos_4 TaxID=1256574 RepID=L7W0B8_9BACT|nr:glycosyl transferase, group 2 family protein [uncultured bacterium A1Q1_fos_4]